LIFIFSILAWLFSVIEAMIAAPIVMTGFAHPEGHEIIGKSDQAIMLLIGVFVRPFVTLLGFVMAMMISVTILKLFNQMILVSAVYYFRSLTEPGINHAVPVMFGVSGLVVLYAYSLMVLLQQSYSMIYLIPDQILKWVGGPAQSAGAGIASVMRSVSSGLSQQSQAAAQGASSTSRSSTSVSTSSQ
jgi:defect-in-organelle-trafficking protein DotA